MNLLNVENIAKSFGERVLFENISFGINQGQKVAFVAKNGTGKTTLLNIIAGKDTSDTGQVVVRKGIKVAYLSQQSYFNPELSIEECILQAENPILKTIATYEKSLQNMDDTLTYQQAHDAMDKDDAWDFETTYKQILYKLQLTDLSQITGTLSGGQKKRLSLAICLLENPDLLLLDEPTNHLDLEIIEWLENFLIEEKMSLFMVTHDRYFLERVCNEIIELDQGEIFRYNGNYSYFLEKRAERLAIEKATLEKAKNLYKRELEWVKRTPMARTTKSKSRIDAFEETQKRAINKRQDHQLQLEINMERLGSKIVELHNISKTFADKKLFVKFDYVFKTGDRIGIIGKNGSGKSTLLNIITNQLKPDSGKVVVGETVKFGFYTQKGIKVNQGQKVIDVIRKYGDYIPLTKGRSISAESLLERFLFSRKQQFDYVEKLSGGEQKRLYLCTVLIQNPNFLILDEPTNDLDIITLSILESFLLDFPGVLLVVSHDRFFMDKVIDHLFVIEVSGIQDFPGDYSDYKAYIDQQEKSSKIVEKPKNSTTKNISPKTALSYKEKEEYKQLEKELEALTEKKAKIEQAFVNASIPEDRLFEAGELLKNVNAEIDKKETRWLELSLLMDA